MTSVQSVGRVWSAAAAVATGVAVTLGLPLQLRGRRLAALLAEPAVVDRRGGPRGRPSDVSVAAGMDGRRRGSPLHAGTIAGEPHGLVARAPAAHTAAQLRAGLWTLRLLVRGRLPGWRNSCLYRAALRCLLLRRAGAPAVLRIGARPRETGAVAAHAWVELLGEPIPEEARPFTVLQRASASA